MKRIRFFNDLLTEKFGSVLHRIPFDLGLSCPNRVNGPGPCAFCAADGARARHLVSGMELRAQAEAGKAYVRERYQSEGPKFCAGFTPRRFLRPISGRWSSPRAPIASPMSVWIISAN